MSDQIKQTTFTLTVLHRADEDPTDLNIESVLQEIDSGSMIGQVDLGRQEDVPQNELQDRLLAIGNDGTFFNDMELDEDD